MNIVDKFKNLTREKKIIAAVGAVLVVAAIVIVCIVISNNKYLATTMRLLRVEGTVNIEDSKGGTRSVTNNMRFQSGDALNTGADGLASVGLDDTKIITLQNDSRAEFLKKGKQLELKLTKGAVFFNVTEKLKADETFEIKTSTMTAGIRGTSGIYYYDETNENRETLVVTDGEVVVSATNKKTGVTKTAKVTSGEKVTVYLFDDKDPEDSVMFELKDIEVDELGRFKLSSLADDEELMKRISTHTGWDEDKLKRVLRGLGDAIAPTDTPTPTPVEETEETPTPPMTPTPEATSTPEPTNTATPSPKPPTNTPKPKTPTKAPTSTPTSVPTTDPSTNDSTEGSTDPSTENSQSKVPTVPDGYSKTVWKDGVYIVDIDNEEFLGWIDGEWQALDQEVRESGDSITTMYYDASGELYYQETVAWPAENPPVNENDNTGYVG